MYGLGRVAFRHTEARDRPHSGDYALFRAKTRPVARAVRQRGIACKGRRDRRRRNKRGRRTTAHFERSRRSGGQRARLLRSGLMLLSGGCGCGCDALFEHDPLLVDVRGEANVRVCAENVLEQVDLGVRHREREDEASCMCRNRRARMLRPVALVRALLVGLDGGCVREHVEAVLVAQDGRAAGYKGIRPLPAPHKRLRAVGVGHGAPVAADQAVHLERLIAKRKLKSAVARAITAHTFIHVQNDVHDARAVPIALGTDALHKRHVPMNRPWSALFDSPQTKCVRISFARAIVSGIGVASNTAHAHVSLAKRTVSSLVRCETAPVCVCVCVCVCA
eukprot:Opistho-1_new@62016